MDGQRAEHDGGNQRERAVECGGMNAGAGTVGHRTCVKVQAGFRRMAGSWDNGPVRARMDTIAQTGVTPDETDHTGTATVWSATISGSVAAVHLDTIASAHTVAAPTTGLGTRFTLEHEALVGGGLWHEGRIVHLAAFEHARSPEAGGWIAE